MEILLTICVLATLVSQSLGDLPCPTELCSCHAPSRDGPIGEGRVIDCRNKGLTYIPIFQPSQEIFQEITFSDNQNGQPNNITSLQNDAFAGLRVKKVNLNNNYLRYVGSTAFSSLAQDLRELFLEGNGFSLAPFEAISTLPELTRLSLTNFFQTSITRTNADFSHLGRLQMLTLKNMEISYIAEDAFVGRLPNLRILHLEFLRLSSFPKRGLAPLTNLEEIRAIYVNLRRLEYRTFSTFKKLYHLDLSRNDITYMAPGCFAGVEESLQFLHLQLNNLSESNIGPLASARLSKLRELNLGHNIMRSIPDGMFFNMKQLRKLNLDSNAINSYGQGSFQGLNSLTSLDISYNSLRGLVPGGFHHTPRLTELDIRGENSVSFEMTRASISGLENTLEKLILTDTSVIEHSMWDAVKLLNNLMDLKLDGTKITHIPEFQFINNPRLETLMIANNQITEINQRNMYGLSRSLKNFNAINNNIRTVDQCTFTDLSKIENLYLNRNPLDCDCRLRWLKEFMVTKVAVNHIFRYKLSAKCATPAPLKARSLFRVDLEQLVCDEDASSTCEDLSNAIPTTVAPPVVEQTTERPTEDESSVFKFTRVLETANGIEASWKLEDRRAVGGLRLEYQLLGKHSETYDVELPSSETNYVISDLVKGSQYLLCMNIFPRVRNVLEAPQRACIVVGTLP